MTTEKQSIKIPYALIAPIWGILMSVGGVWWTQNQAASEQKTQIALVKNDVGNIRDSVHTLDTKVEVLTQASYTVAEARRDNDGQNRTLSDHEDRIRHIEAARRK